MEAAPDKYSGFWNLEKFGQKRTDRLVGFAVNRGSGETQFQGVTVQTNKLVSSGPGLDIKGEQQIAVCESPEVGHYASISILLTIRMHSHAERGNEYGDKSASGSLEKNAVSLLQARTDAYQGRNQKTLEKNHSKDQDHRTEINAAHGGNIATDSQQQGICHLNQETDNGIIRVSIDPGDNGPADYNPDIGGQGKADELGNG